MNALPALAATARIATLLALVLSSAFAPGQDDALLKPGAPLAFDVAVIRPFHGDTSGHAHSHFWTYPSDSRLKAENVTTAALIQYAFSMPETRIEGGPPWMRTKPFDLEAKSDAAIDEQFSKLPFSEVRARKERMLQSLLADRFALKLHQETRTQPIYALMLAKGGPKFGPSQANGTTVSGDTGNGSTRVTVRGSDHTLRLLAEQLSKSLGRVVVDKTGVDGRFDLTLTYTADDAVYHGPDPASAPSVFTALQEQLGLKLEPEKGPVTILVIDHIEPPSEN